MQYRFPVGVGPSSKTCPRCEPQRAHVISVRAMPPEVSVCVSIALGNAWSNEGQPVPESNFASDEKSGLPHATHAYVPAFSWTYSPVKGASVPFSRNTLYCSGVSVCFHPSSLSGMGFSPLESDPPWAGILRPRFIALLYQRITGGVRGSGLSRLAPACANAPIPGLFRDIHLRP